MKKIIVALTLLSALSRAEEITPVFLKKGDVSPVSGWLFTETQEKDLRFKLIKGQDFESLYNIKNDQITLYKAHITDLNEQVSVWRKTSQDFSREVIEARDSNFWQRFAFFGLGVLTTVLITYGVNK